MSPEVWLRADVGLSLVGSDVNAWTDQSAHARVFTAINAAKRPVSLTEAPLGPVIRFRPAAGGGGDDTLLCPAVDFGAEQFHWAALVTRAPATDQVLFASGTTQCNWELSRAGKIAFSSGFCGTADSLQLATAAAQVLAWHCVGKDVKFYRNGALLTTITMGVNVVGAGNEPAYLGSVRDLAGWCDCDLAEYVLLNAGPTAAQLAKLAEYSAGRYGI